MAGPVRGVAVAGSGVSLTTLAAVAAAEVEVANTGPSKSTGVAVGAGKLNRQASPANPREMASPITRWRPGAILLTPPPAEGPAGMVCLRGAFYAILRYRILAGNGLHLPAGHPGRARGAVIAVPSPVRGRGRQGHLGVPRSPINVRFWTPSGRRRNWCGRLRRRDMPCWWRSTIPSSGM